MKKAQSFEQIIWEPNIHIKKKWTDITSFTKINWKCFLDLNTKCKTTLIEDNIGENLYKKILGLIMIFLDKFDFARIKTLHKTLSRKYEDKPQTGRKHYKIIFDKELFRIHKELLKPNKNMNNLI